MSSVIEKAFRRVLGRFKRIALSNRMIRRVLGDVENEIQFSDLFEHERMLADGVRMSAYQAAIERYVKPGDVVIDLGTGTGALSLMAASRKPRKIYALDHSNVLQLAKVIAERNGVQEIEFVRVNSRDFAIPDKADIVLHEQMGSDLFDERMIGNVLDLKERLLKEGGRILPSRFDLYIEPVSLKPEYRVPYIWENSFCGVDYGVLRNAAVLNGYKRSSYQCRHIPATAVSHFLCEPKPVLTFDFDRPCTAESLCGVRNVSRPVVHAGAMNGWCLFFRAVFDQDIALDTSPLRPPTHWRNRLFRAEQRNCAVGEALSYRVDFGDIECPSTWSVSSA